ncbi:phosphatase [Vibrio coralliirubri]|uniref:phosphatase n=1 Tax=Vibrio coralliirubri TaxID=1516159 RepID=UPI002283DA12|nr:phosphatase [Vibrio coralliirubri]MCY9861296.1 phosphatase [Vibrio coralliirubri]
MKLNTINGDLVKLAKVGVFDVIVHCQNCFHGWKKGIVVSIGEAFPEAIEADLKTIKGDQGKLGSYSFAKIKLDTGKVLFVVNLYAQYSFGQGKHINESYLAEGLKKLNSQFSGMKIGYPLIGCGQAGAEWGDISQIVDENLVDVQHQLVVLN